MKKIAIFIILNLFSNSYSQELISKDDFKAFKKTLPSILDVHADYIEHIIWVETPEIYFMGLSEIGRFGESAKVHKFYFAVQKNSEGKLVHGPMRYKFTYKATDWLFMDKILVLTAKSNSDTRQGIGTQYTIKLDYSKVKKTVFIGAIREEFDITDDPAIIAWLKDVSETGNFSRLRIYGDKGYEDSILRTKDLQPGASAILAAYNAF